MTSWPEVLGALSHRQDLTVDQAGWAMEQILQGEATDGQFGAFVMGLRSKGESAVEVEALADTMLAHARHLDFGADPLPLALDVVGTGGDQAHTVNISTMAALVAAAAGATVVKNGNRAASSSTGTADVLEHLGVAIELEPDMVVASVREAGIGFCFAPVHHPALRHAGPIRRELAIPTVFNILGPLANPAGVQSALIGCANEALAPVMADVLLRRGVTALVVRGEDGLDEISIAAPTRVWDATGSEVGETVLDAADLGIPRTPQDLLRGGDSARNAELLRAALSGDDPEGEDAPRVLAIRDAVAVNAAAALAAFVSAGGTIEGMQGDAASPSAEASVTDRVRACLPVARRVIDDGSALRILDAWAGVTTRLRESG